MSFKIKTMGPTEKFKTQYGEMMKYTVQFEGADDWVSINQKPETPAPTVGQELEGEIEQTQYGAKFKKAAAGFTGGGGGGKSYTPDPETRGSIERQTALKAAVVAVHNYSTIYGVEDKLTLEQYAGRIVNLSKVFATAIAGQSETPKAPEPAPQIGPNDTVIDLSDIPF